MNTRHRRRGLAAGALTSIALLAAACGGSSGSGASGPATNSSGGASAAAAGKTSAAAQKVSLQLMIGSSGDAETKAVQDAAAAWSQKTGNQVTVIPAKDINQQLTQALAGGTPPDLFYVDASRVGTLADGGALAVIGDQIGGKSDFYPSLVDTFTLNGKYYCPPKDFSTLALEINTDMWKQAGLTDADIPTTWNQLESDAKKLTNNGHVGLVISDTRDRIGAFMKQAGGWLVSTDGGQVKMTADSQANLTALQFVQKLLKEGVMKFPKQVDSGWGGEALGKGKAAMTIEGNWIVGAMKSDYPNIHYRVVELPAGPAGKGTLSFTQCWGVAAKGQHQAQTLDFVKFLTSPEQQMTFSKAFGVMPSRIADKDAFAQAFPDQKAFVDGASYAQGPVTVAGMDQVLTDFDSQLAGLATGQTDPKALLQRLQKNGEAVLNDQ